MPGKAIGAVLFLAAGWLFVAATPSASGATAKVGINPGSCVKLSCDRPEIVFTAAAGETNVVTITPVGAPATSPSAFTSLVIRDDGAPITPGGNCAKVDDATVSCGPPPISAPWIVSINAGDMNDSVTVAAVFGPWSDGTIRGGPGDDRLVGGIGSDSLVGEDGADTLLGGGGDDTLVASDGSAATATDAIDGGDGKDTVSYAERRSSVSVTLGASSNEDKLTSIESVIGGRGNDVLVGDASDNTLDGAGGEDVLRGGGGADVLEGGLLSKAADRLYGGAGDDSLQGSGGADRLYAGSGNDTLGYSDRGTTSCGPGEDTVEGTYADNLVPVECERVDLGAVIVIGRPRRVARGIIRVRCALPSDFDPDTDYVPRIKLSKGRRLVGKSRRVRRNQSMAIRLTRVGSRLAKRGTVVVIRENTQPLTSKGEAFSVRIR